MIKIVVVGAGGNQGQGICYQTSLFPDLELVGVVDKNRETCLEAAKISKQSPTISDNLQEVLELRKPDIMVEATNSVESAAKYSIMALEHGAHVVLMNAEVDLLLGPYLHHLGDGLGLTVTSDAGDQHGVIARMVQEIRGILGLKPVLLGNIKGYLDKYATNAKMVRAARDRYLNVSQCVGYSDGTKLNIEMALLANAFRAHPIMRGMEGPKLNDVREVLTAFDFESYGHRTIIDYILGAKPGGGVFVIAKETDILQRRYLDYYKMGKGPYYLFYRPYHLCHLETPLAIRSAYRGEKILEPLGKFCEVFAFAKRHLASGTEIESGIGSDDFYGMVDDIENAKDLIPIALLENETGGKPHLVKSVKRDEALHWNDIELPKSHLLWLYREQEKILIQEENFERN